MSGLKFIALSGTVSVTHNLYIYEYDNSMMILDCGVGFPDIDMKGIELVLPDFSYVIKNKDKLKGILLSQGHEDHIGALPYLLREVSTEIWSTKLVSEFIADKFFEHRIEGVKINVFDPDRERFRIGPFEITPFRVNHSVPDTVGFAIDTPEGRVMHIAEYKFDSDPVDGHKFDVDTAKKLSEEKKVLMLASDCLGSTRPGSTPSEKPIEDNLLKVMQPAKNAIFFTTISSNIGRIQQVINVAERLKRKVVFVGRSIEKKSEIAHALGYIKYRRNTVVSIKDSQKIRGEELLYVIAGCYGQVGSSLYRVATNEHTRVYVEKGDMVVFSADPAPPYTKESENFIIDKLIELGADVHYYELDEGLYVSGHGSQDDILRLLDIVKPKYHMPVGGTVRFMHGYKKLAEGIGVRPENIYELKPGGNITIERGVIRKGKKIPVKDVLVHGLGIGDIGRVVLQDRKVLGEEGFVVVVIKVNAKSKKMVSDPEIVSRGFVFEKQKMGLLKASSRQMRRQAEKKKVRLGELENFATKYLQKFFKNEIGRNPMIIPVVVEV